MKPLAVSMGDPCGIGPEIIAKAWQARSVEGVPPFFVLGDSRAIEAVWPGPVARIKAPDQADDVFKSALPVLNMGGSGGISPGTPTLEGAQSALAALEMAIGLTRSGASSALVTGPVAKAQLYKAGFTHPGQTEFIAEHCGIAPDRVVMLLAGPSLRVALVTIHIPLAEVPARLSVDLIASKARIVARGLLRDFGIEKPRLAVAGLNPHAGEDGALGKEDAAIIGPAVEILKAEGINAIGPVPPDALFTPRMRETYDAVLCMYHDQGLIPLKALHVDDGVNMSLGLHIVRTSPDHGTAFDIAGRNKAHPGAMIAALKMAASAAHYRATSD